MRLYVIDGTGSKKYLSAVARDRAGLANVLGRDDFSIDGASYSVSQVYAEASADSTAAGSLFGGVIGAAAGPIGILVGGILGGLIGGEQARKEKAPVAIFNSSSVEKKVGAK
jgi:phage tail tape-measure protein